MIVVQYFRIPTTNSLNQFMYRINFQGLFSPWLVDYVIFSSDEITFKKNLKNFFLEKYRKMVTDAMPKDGDVIPEEYFDMLRETTIELVDCDIAPKQDPSGYIKEIL